MDIVEKAFIEAFRTRLEVDVAFHFWPVLAEAIFRVPTGGILFIGRKQGSFAH